MVQIIAGKKGKGKTKHLLDMANAAIKGANGTVVYLDKSAQHMYELNNRIRLINVNEFPLASSEGFWLAPQKIAIALAAAAALSIAGYALGRKMLGKHFKPAGVV